MTGRDEIDFVGTVTWWACPLGRDLLNNLEAHAATLPSFRAGIDE